MIRSLHTYLFAEAAGQPQRSHSTHLPFGVDVYRLKLGACDLRQELGCLQLCGVPFETDGRENEHFCRQPEDRFAHPGGIFGILAEQFSNAQMRLCSPRDPKRVSPGASR